MKVFNRVKSALLNFKPIENGALLILKWH